MIQYGSFRRLCGFPARFWHGRCQCFYNLDGKPAESRTILVVAFQENTQDVVVGGRYYNYLVEDTALPVFSTD